MLRGSVLVARREATVAGPSVSRLSHRSGSAARAYELQRGTRRDSLLWAHRTLATSSPSSVSSASLSSSSAQPYHQNGDSQHGESPQLQQLRELRDLIVECGGTNSRIEKENYLRASTSQDSANLLLFLYDDHVRLYTSASQLMSYLRQHGLVDGDASKSRQATLPHEEEARRVLYDCGHGLLPSMHDVLGLLDSREVSGHLALSVLAIFLQDSGALQATSDETTAWRGEDSTTESGSKTSIEELVSRAATRLTVLECFCRCLDRNLRAGINAKTLRSVFVSGSPKPPTASTSGKESRAGDAEEYPRTKRADEDRRSRGKSAFEVALGKTIEKDQLHKLFPSSTADTPEHGEEWYVSRKLDGVRCVVQVDIALPLTEGKLEVLSVESFSRSGRRFNGLKNLEEELKGFIAGSTVARNIISKSLDVGQEPGPRGDKIARLYLDGECCALIPRHKAHSTSPMTVHQGHQIVVDSSSVSPSAAVGKEEDPLAYFVEDFTSVASALQRKNFTIHRPAFFPFDVLTFSEFANWRSGPPSSATFEERVKTRIEPLVDECNVMSAEASRVPLVRKLHQEKINTPEQVHRWIEEAAERGWEGIMLRKAGSLYEGKRTTDIRKFKQWREAEYVVEDVSINEMRLPIGKRYGQRRALASVWVDHNGVKVSIGSGFSVEERLAFAEDPQLILGKEITVQFFEESKSSARTASATVSGEGLGDGEIGQQLLSLRFPRVKKIWMEGRRNM